MNKKNLSVVMAGAMLATSVAPVLAEVTTSEISADNLGLLIEKLKTKLTGEKFANETQADKIRNGSEAGKSVYFIRVNGETKSLNENSTQEEYQNFVKSLESGDKVEIWSKGFIKEDEKLYATKEVKPLFTETTLDSFAKSLVSSFTGTIADGNLVLTDVATNYENIIESVKFDNYTKELKVDFVEKVNNDNHVDDLTLKAGENTELVSNQYINANGNIMSTSSGAIKVDNFFGFVEKVNKKEDLPAEKVEEITITSGGYNLALEDLYDGLMLTTEGHDFLYKIKEADSIQRGVKFYGSNGTYKIESVNHIENNVTSKNGVTKFFVEFDAVPNKKLPNERYTITAKNEKEAERVLNWMLSRLARVDILAGDNRYETAVKIAKENAMIDALEPGYSPDAKEANIVLVNGDALVDGLAAAPLASSLDNAPILLSRADSLPIETKSYLRELIEAYKIQDIDKVTINLVGGETVLSKSLERELKSMGFSVERFGGDNREETSLEVKEAIESNGGKTDQAFVVGANGEADAMSIAAVAAELRTPIVVAKKGGISEDAVYELKNDYVTIVGGESVVSKSEEKFIGTEAKSVDRVSGSNRQKTNAEVISRYYKDEFVGEAENVIIAKDGKTNESHLIDALAAANLATRKNAPIVLATDKLSVEQRSALNLNAKKAEALYQVGIGVERSVVEYIADLLGLTGK